MPNRLAQSASPYLLQHAENPVDWYEWSDEAFAEAERRDVPILLSVGYAACHWCHVMAHESFEDEPTAAVMNARFVNIKVDREERPDIDRIYMDATQAMTGRGGWPMTVFLTPSGGPFFAGTYFPKEGHHGMPSFMTILDAISSAWDDRRDDVDAQAAQLSAAVDHQLPRADIATNSAVLETAYRRLAGEHDTEYGGFGGAPKFPQGPALEFLLRIATEPWAPGAAAIVEHTLLAMADGGIYDQLGGGFSRYSVDRQWLVPHFEKMLYDNALLARLYLRSGQVTGNERLTTIARQTIDYMLRDLALSGGGLASSEDADSEGAEGTFYVWSHDEFREATGDDATLAGAAFGVTTGGNFEGSNILSMAVPTSDVADGAGVELADVDRAVERARRALFDRRLARTRPDRDDKVVTAWNGLALRAIAEAALVLDDADYLGAAQGLGRFLIAEMKRADGRWLRARRQGVGEVTGFCDDYAGMVLGLLALHQADGSSVWLAEAVATASDMVELFAADEGGFHAVGTDADDLIARPLDVMDNPVPSGNSLAAEALMALGHLTGDDPMFDLVQGAVHAGSGLFESHPAAVGHLLAVAHSRNADPRELAIVGAPEDARTKALVAVAASQFRPEVFLARADGAEPPVAIFEGRLPAPHPMAYLCRRFSCEAPTSDPDVLMVKLSRNMPHS